MNQVMTPMEELYAKLSTPNCQEVIVTDLTANMINTGKGYDYRGYIAGLVEGLNVAAFLVRNQMEKSLAE